MIRNIVVVGIDDTSASLAAMEWAADYARMIDAKLTAIHVCPTEFPRSSTDPASTTLDKQAEIRIRAIFYSVRPEPDWTLSITRGSAGETLVKAAEHAVALVVGSRQMTGLDGVLHHSVSRYCTLHAKGPIVICPDLDEADAHFGDDHSGATEEWSPPKISIRPSRPVERFPVTALRPAARSDRRRTHDP